MRAKDFLILQWEKISTRFSAQEESVLLPFAISERKSILICLPEYSDDPNHSQTLVLKYQAFFLGRPILFCAPSSQEPFIKSSCSCLYYNSTSLSFPNKLKHAIREALFPATYQLAIDLNSHFSLPAALICKKSKAKTRITFEKPNARWFFNVLLQPDELGEPFHLSVMKHYLQSITQVINSEESSL